MPRVHTLKARADIYRTGLQVKDEKTKTGFRRDRSQPADSGDTVIVKKGQTYYKWSFRYGGTHISITRPRASQLTQSDFLSRMYAIQERLEDLSIANYDSPDDLECEIEEIKSEIEELRDECEEKRNNMPDSLQNATIGEMLQNRYDSCDEMINDIESVDLSDWNFDEDEVRSELDEDFDEAEKDEEVSDKRRESLDEWLEDKICELSGISYNGE